MNMKRKIVNFTWDNEDAQAAFAEWCPFPDAISTSDDIDRIEDFVGITPPLRVLDVGCGMDAIRSKWQNVDIRL